MFLKEIFCIVTIILSASISSAASVNENLVILKYSQPVHGINVQVLWKL